MKTSFLVTTAVSLVLSAAASAQSTTSPSSPTSQAPAATAPAPTSAQPASPSGSATTSPAAQAPASNTPASNQNAQTAPRSNDTAPASNAAAPANNPSAPASATQPSNAATSGTTSTAPSNAASQNVPANTGGNSPATPTGTTQQNANTPASSTTNINASVNLNTQQQTLISDTLSRTRVQPLTNVNFSLSVGTVIPRDVSLHTVPAGVVEVVPQYRGFSYVVVKDEFVIIDPSSYRIVTVISRSGASAAATAPAKRTTFSDRDRDAVRKYSKTTIERRTVGSSNSVQVRRGERLPSSVEIEEFPETVYRDAPALKEYRYIRRDSRTYLVDPAERVVIEEID